MLRRVNPPVSDPTHRPEPDVAGQRQIAGLKVLDRNFAAPGQDHCARTIARHIRTGTKTAEVGI
jgi:hypothetical protein